MVCLNKHQQKTEQTKRKLLAAARRVFSRDGFDGSRIDDIARLAGFTRGAFYAHFKSKEDLFFALLEEQSEIWMERVRTKLSGNPTDEQVLAVLRESWIAGLSDSQWPILLLEFKLYAVRHRRMRARLVEAHRRIRNRLKLEKIRACLPERWVNDATKREHFRFGLEALMSGLVLQMHFDPSSLKREDAETVLRTCFDVLTKDLLNDVPAPSTAVTKH